MTDTPSFQLLHEKEMLEQFPHDIDKFLQKPNHPAEYHFLCMEVAGHLVGIATLGIYDTNLDVAMLEIEPGSRGKHYSEQLLQQIFQEASQRKLPLTTQHITSMGQSRLVHAVERCEKLYNTPIETYQSC